MSTHLDVIAAGFEETIATTRELIAAYPCAIGFGITFEITNRPAEADEPAQPDDTVRWTAATTLTGNLGDLLVTGTALVEPGGRQAIGISYACIRLLRKLGISTLVVDATSDQEPPL